MKQSNVPVCRCCKNEGLYKDLKSRHEWQHAQQEVDCLLLGSKFTNHTKGIIDIHCRKQSCHIIQIVRSSYLINNVHFSNPPGPLIQIVRSSYLINNVNFFNPPGPLIQIVRSSYLINNVHFFNPPSPLIQIVRST